MKKIIRYVIGVKFMTKLYMGIDGGGTGTKLYLIDEDENVVFQDEGDRTSVDTVSYDVSFNNILKIIEGFDFKGYEVMSVFAGLGGVVTKEHKDEMISRLKTLPGNTKNTIVVVENDVINALASGLIFDNGMTLIVGTGMSAFGKHGNQTHKAGGWGFKEGDAGSSFDLGLQAIKKAIRAKDMRITATDFTNEVSNVIGLKEAKDIISIMDSLYLDRTKVASFAPLVTKHANLGDIHAMDIVNLATTELMLCVQSIYKTLAFDEATLVVVGSLGNAKGVFKDLLHHKIKETSPKITITEPKVDPGFAAALLALKRSFTK